MYLHSVFKRKTSKAERLELQFQKKLTAYRNNTKLRFNSLEIHGSPSERSKLSGK